MATCSSSNPPSALYWAYKADLDRVKGLASTDDERSAVGDLEASLRAGKAPCSYIRDEVTKIIRKAQRVDRYGH